MLVKGAPPKTLLSQVFRYCVSHEARGSPGNQTCRVARALLLASASPPTGLADMMPSVWDVCWAKGARLSVGRVELSLRLPSMLVQGFAVTLLKWAPFRAVRGICNGLRRYGGDLSPWVPLCPLLAPLASLPGLPWGRVVVALHGGPGPILARSGCCSMTGGHRPLATSLS